MSLYSRISIRLSSRSLKFKFSNLKWCAAHKLVSILKVTPNIKSVCSRTLSDWLIHLTLISHWNKWTWLWASLSCNNIHGTILSLEDFIIWGVWGNHIETIRKCTLNIDSEIEANIIFLINASCGWGIRINYLARSGNNWTWTRR
jgi:hypothetical protein